MHEDRPGRPDDAALVRLVAGGSYDALASLYDRHGDAVFAAACRLTSDRGVAEEVVQDTFLALWDRAESYDPRLPDRWRPGCTRSRGTGRSIAFGPPADARSSCAPPSGADGVDSETQLLERAAAAGNDRRGLGRTGRSGGSPRLEGDEGVDRVGPRNAWRSRNGPSSSSPTRGPQPDGDRRSAGVAARDGEDTDPPGAAAAARGPRGTSGGTGQIRRRRVRKTMDHDEVLESARAGGGRAGRSRPADGRRHAAAQAVAGHLAGCPACTLELERLRRLGAVVRDTVVHDAAARPARTDAGIRAPARRAAWTCVGAGRGPSACPVAAVAARSHGTPGRGRGRPSSTWVAVGRGGRAALGCRDDADHRIRASTTRLAAQEDAIEDLATVTTATLQVTGRARRRAGRVWRAPTGDETSGTLALLPVDDRARRRRRRRSREPAAGMEYRCWVDGRRRPPAHRQDVLRRRARLLGRAVARGGRTGRRRDVRRLPRLARTAASSPPTRS